MMLFCLSLIEYERYAQRNPRSSMCTMGTQNGIEREREIKTVGEGRKKERKKKKTTYNEGVSANRETGVEKKSGRSSKNKDETCHHFF
jgi:hypothetical protein